MSMREEFIQGLRDMADFLDARPQIPLELEHTFLIYLDPAKFKAAVREIGGRGVKELVGDYAHYVAAFGPVRLNVFVERDQVCKRIVVGEKEVPEQTIPAHTEEIVEWECEPWLENQS